MQNTPGVTIGPGNGGLERISIDTALATAEMYLHGAHVTRYQPRSQSHPILWMSEKSNFIRGKAIRGGVPICFPWFGPKVDDPKAPAHGFARTSMWNLTNVIRDGDHVRISLELNSSDATRAIWPHDFQATYTVILGPFLSTELKVRNTGNAPFTFEEAMHSYFTVGDVKQIRVRGLEGATYLDRLKPGQRFTQSNDPITFSAELDRTYVNTSAAVTIDDPALSRRIQISKSNSKSTVVWNPWIGKSKSMPDFDDDEWARMVCIETANAGENAVTLSPGESHLTVSSVSAASSP